MRQYAQIVSKITTTPWMMYGPALQLLLEVVDAHISGTMTEEQIRVRLQGIDKRGTGSHSSRAKNIGVLGIYGPIFPKANMMTEMSGGTTIEQLQRDYRSMMADDSIGAILLDVDSPGGSSEGIVEMADEFREGRESKPLYAIANHAANSAAYGLAAQASELFATKSAQVGSTGTFMVHTDRTRAEQAAGVDRTVIHAGRFKAVTMEPLNVEGKNVLQSFVDSVNDQFLDAIAQGRGVPVEKVRQDYGEGAVLSSSQGMDAGVVDGIGTYESVLNHIADKLGSGGTVSNMPVAASSAGSLQLRQSHDAGKEHSEPGSGTGGEPTPREAPETGDPAIEQGWRRDTPPPPHTAVETEESAVNREWMEAQATRLGVEFSAETSDDDLAAALAGRIEEVVVPIANATSQAQDERDFREAYPEQAAQLGRLEQQARETAATSFADTYMSFEGRPNVGFSPVVRNLIAQAHLNISTLQFTHENLAELLQSATAEAAIVPLGEAGSARASEVAGVAPTGDVRQIRKQFSDLVKSAMTEDNMTREAAIAHVSAANPDLANAYLTAK